MISKKLKKDILIGFLCLGMGFIIGRLLGYLLN
jgi:hypothetical protein